MNLMNLWDKAIEDYEKAKVPLMRSIYLNERQRSLVLDLVRTGITEDEVVTTIRNTNQQIRSQKNQAFARSDIPLDEILQENVKLLNHRGPLDMRNYDYMTSEDTKIAQTQRYLFDNRDTKVNNKDLIFTDVRAEYKNLNNTRAGYAPDVRTHLAPHKEMQQATKTACPNQVRDQVLRSSGHVYMVPDKAPSVQAPARTFHSNPGNRSAHKDIRRTNGY
jgi:hypothetical protein